MRRNSRLEMLRLVSGILRKRRCFPCLGIAALFLLIQCNSSIAINSTRLKDKIIIDGDISDWNGLIKKDPDEKFGIGIANDDSSLYVCLISEDRRIIREVMKHGMTIWFETGKSDRNRIGLRFPMGTANSRGAFRGFRQAQGDTEAVRRMIEESFETMEILGPGKEDTVPMKTTVAENFGIKLKAVPDMGKFACEVKVPFSPIDSTSKYFISGDKNSLITIVLESSSAQNNGPGLEHNRYGNGSSGSPKELADNSTDDLMSGYRRMNAGAQYGNHEPSEPFSAKFYIKVAK